MTAVGRAAGAGGLGATERRDAWWLGPLATAVALGSFIVYSTFRAIYNTDYHFGVGTDNLFAQQDGTHFTVRFTVSNFTNKIALYNFHSTFTGTHFVAPRTYQGAIGFVF